MADARERFVIPAKGAGDFIGNMSGEPLERALQAGREIAGEEDLAHAAFAEAAEQEKTTGESFEHW